MNNNYLFKVEKRPYANYENIEYYIYRRDNFTCTHCGYKTKKRIFETFGCALLPDWFDELALFNRHPSFCPALDEVGFKLMDNCLSFKCLNDKIIPCNKIPVNPCSECDYFVLYFIEDFEKGNLVVHHKNNNPCDNRYENLITLCKSCNNLNVHRKKKQKNKSCITGGGDN